jgi:hypothetical protein
VAFNPAGTLLASGSGSLGVAMLRRSARRNRRPQRAVGVPQAPRRSPEALRERKLQAVGEEEDKEDSRSNWQQDYPTACRADHLPR